MFHLTTGAGSREARVIHSTSGCCHLTDLGAGDLGWLADGWFADGYLTDFGGPRWTLTVILAGSPTAI